MKFAFWLTWVTQDAYSAILSIISLGSSDMPRLSVSVDNELKFDDEVITGIVVGVPVFVSFETTANKIE